MKMLILLLALCLPVQAWACGPPVYLPGDVLATRNATEEENSTPGYWNHLAIYVGDGQVVEAQMGRGVIVSGLPEFIARYPEIRLLRLRSGKGQAMATEAWRHVGTRYRKLASLPVFMRPTQWGNNCVSVVRRCVCVSIGRDPRWRLPDDGVGSALFEILGRKG